MDEEEAPRSKSSTQSPHKKSRNGKNTLKAVSLEEPSGQPLTQVPPQAETNAEEESGGMKTLRNSPFQIQNSFFKMLFTDEMIEHNAHQEMGDPIKTESAADGTTNRAAVTKSAPKDLR